MPEIRFCFRFIAALSVLFHALNAGAQIHAVSFIPCRWVDISNAGTLDWVVFGSQATEHQSSLRALEYKKGGSGIQKQLVVSGNVQFKDDPAFQRFLSWNDGTFYKRSAAIASGPIPITGCRSVLMPGASVGFSFEAPCNNRQYLASIMLTGHGGCRVVVRQGKALQTLDLQKKAGVIQVLFTGSDPLHIQLEPSEKKEITISGFAAILSEKGLWWIRDGRFAALYQPIPVENILNRTNKTAPPYLETAQKFADCMLQYGRDHYGTVHSPLFTVMLSREKKPSLLPYPLFAKSNKPVHLDTLVSEYPVVSAAQNPFNRFDYNLILNYPQGLGEEGPHKITLYGCDLYEDRALYQLFFDLTRITKNNRYREASEAAINYWFRNTQGPSGLYPWGEHMSWDLRNDIPLYFSGASRFFFEANYHEVRDFVPFINYLEAIPAVRPGEKTPLERYALGIWKEHFWDKEKAYYNRHGDYRGQVDQTKEWGAFPAHLAFYLRIWTAAFLHTKDATVKAQLSEQFHRTIKMAILRTKKYGFYPFSLLVELKGEDPGKVTPVQTLRLASHCVWIAHQLEDQLPSVADSLRELAKLNLGEQPEEETLRNLKWAEQLDDTRFIQGQKDPKELPGPFRLKDLSREVMSEEYANEIIQNVWYYHQTGDKAYIQTADKYGRIAYAAFCDNKSPLPRAFAKGVPEKTVSGSSFPDFYFKGAKLMRAFALLGEVLQAEPGIIEKSPEKNVPAPVLINADWTFTYLPSEVEDSLIRRPDFDDSRWPAIALPFTWSVYETTGEKHPFIRNPSEQDDPYWWKGWGYFRKRMVIGNELQGKKIFLEFDGVQKYARIYLNGNFVEEHKGGYTSFCVDLTSQVQWGKENILVVVVSNRRDDRFRIPPMTAGNFNVYGGIYRDVRLVIKNPTYIPYQGSYKYDGGTFLTTPSVDSQNALISIKTFVKNDYKHPRLCTLLTTVRDPQGRLVASLQQERLFSAGASGAFIQQAHVSNPALWSPDHPSLYSVTSVLLAGREVLDRYATAIGLRWFHWDYTSNELYLNGNKINIKGTNRHQEYPWLGDAIPKWITRKDLVDIKVNLGHNFMRTAHYPNDPYCYDLADSLGIMIVEEVPNIKSIDFDESVQEQNVREMIRRDRNHPSILFWSMGNETTDAADSKWAVEEDTTRIIHLRKGTGGGAFVQHTDKNLDMENLLRVTIRGWYDAEDAPAAISSTPQNGQVAGNESWQWKNAMISNASTRGILGKNCVSWLYEDHGCDREYLNSPLKHVNAKGWVDIYREPKYIYYLTKAMYTDTPVVAIHNNVWRRRYIGQQKEITVDCNGEEVELFVNGVSKGKLYPSKRPFPTVTFSGVVIEPGELKAVATIRGRKYENKLEMPGEPAAIVLTTDQQTLPADRSGIAVIKANIVDGAGNPVFDASNTLSWKVTGAGKLVGAPIYESDRLKHEEMEGTGYITVPVSNVVRTLSVPGWITVEVTSPGLEAGKIQLEAVASSSHNPSPFIRLPKLQDNRRATGVKRLEIITPPVAFKKVIQPIPGNVFLKPTGEGDYLPALNRFILQNNPKMDTGTYAYRAIAERMTEQLKAQKGELIADDYNFIGQHYNEYEMVKRLVDSKTLPLLYADFLKNYYEREIIEKNRAVDVEEALKRIRSIPDKQTAVAFFQPGAARPAGTGQKDNVLHIEYVWATGLYDALTTLYPALAEADTREWELMEDYVLSNNPQIIKKGQSYYMDNVLLDRSKLALKHENKDKDFEGTLFFIPEPSFLLRIGKQ